MYVRLCVWGYGPSQIPSVSFVPSQHAGVAVSGLHHGRRGVARRLGITKRRSSRAPRFQLYLHCVGPCRARGGCRAPVSSASVAQGAVCWLDAFTAAWLGDCHLWLV